jgi:DNA-binding NtrC family response regulator
LSKLHSIARRASDDLRSRVHFCPETGQIWLHEHRMLLVHAEAQGALRKDLIDSLGMERARGLLTRMGYASGLRDAELARTRAENCSDIEAFMTGPQLHTLEGIVHVTPVKVELDRAQGRFHGEFLWQNSWEGQWHRHHYGIHSEPVCWTQIGYACGYTSAFMGRPILYKETECVGKGDNNCRIVGKPAEEWEDAATHMRFLTPESIADQLIELQSQVVHLRSTLSDADKPPADLVCNSPGFRAAYELLVRAANKQVTVLLLGETGVGKELFARALHRMGSRRERPFVAVNCAAIPNDLVESELFGVEKGAYTGALVSRPGRFERADGGCLFLDEIGDLPLSAQSKLLRVLQEGEIERLGDLKTRKVDVRVVAATNGDLRQLVKAGRFRPDLYYRLNGYQIGIPPLRERKEDIPLLAKWFLQKYTALHDKNLRGYTDKAKRALLTYSWPGNIRELQNMVERGVILAPGGTRIEVEHLFSTCPEEQAQEFGLDIHGSVDAQPGGNTMGALCEAVFNGVTTLDQLEVMLIETAVDKARGNLSAAARLLGLTRPQLAYRLKRLHEADASENESPRTPPGAPGR